MGGLEFKTWTGQILYSIANGSTSTQVAVLPGGAMTRSWEPQIRYTLQRKTSVSDVGGMEFKSRVNQILHTLHTAHLHCNFDVWALAQSRRDENPSIVIPERY